jgi:hypothetical protein
MIREHAFWIGFMWGAVFMACIIGLEAILL